MKTRFTTVIVTTLALFGLPATAADVKLTIPEHPMSAYIVDIVSQSLEAQGHTAEITVDAKSTENRIEAMITKGEKNMATFKLSRGTVENAVVVPVGLTGGLLGKRVFFVRPGEQDAFANIKTVKDLQESGLMGGFGENWFDVNIWKANDLDVTIATGKWQKIYRMLAEGNRNIDYFSRGIMEIAVEAPLHPDLAVEPNLIVSYDGDFNLYLSPANKDDAGVLGQALNAAIESGLREQLVRQYFPVVFDPDGLNMDGRHEIKLNMPS
ncbi:hypothetical protein [Parasulfitobacter algicola]|uniref:Solute-binding protein family 3/N-terminal domain-containing protein n=1 Tax=Parasulfitobacter algicola TaxID=2614809 RepID=A0ABX2IVY7_9RHOB|nr:hypothetical protein [Sulfitobacter algicola]NSX56685.1 hypothetical protein [Sulfitobacter algicola]